MIGAFQFGRVMYSGSPTEPVERGAAVSLAFLVAASTCLASKVGVGTEFALSAQPAIASSVNINLATSLFAKPVKISFAGAQIRIGFSTICEPSIRTSAKGQFGFSVTSQVSLRQKSTSSFAIIVSASPNIAGKAKSQIQFSALGEATLSNEAQSSATFSLSARPTIAQSARVLLEFDLSATGTEPGASRIKVEFGTKAKPTRHLKARSDITLATSAEASIRTGARVTTSFSFSARPIVGVIHNANIELQFSTPKADVSIGTDADLQAQFRLEASGSVLNKARSAIDFKVSTKVGILDKARKPITFAASASSLTKVYAQTRIRIEFAAEIESSIVGRVITSLAFATTQRPRIAAKASIPIGFGIKAHGSAFRSEIKVGFAVTALNQPPNEFATIGVRFRTSCTPTIHEVSPAFIDQRLRVGGVDLSGRLVSWTLRFENDSGAWTLDVELTNHHELVKAGYGLAPWDPNSIYNSPSPLLGSYNPVTLEIKKDGWIVWKKLFTGWAGPASVSAPERWGEANHIRATFVGISQPLKDWMIEERLALRYTNAAISAEGQPDLLNRIVMDQGFSVPIVYKNDPMFMVDEYIISHVSLWQALENALAPTGFRLLEWWDPITGETAITVLDPLRFKIQPDRIQVGGFSARDIAGYEADVRTWVGVVYRDRNDFQEKLVWAEASPSIVAVYGIPDGSGGRKHRKMIYKTASRSLIDTESEARELAAVILWDVETPSPTVEITIPTLDETYYPFQLVEFVGDYFSTLVGIQDIEHSWSWERPCGQTVLRGARGKVVGARSLWFTRDTRRGYAREFQDLEEITETAYTITPDAPWIFGSWFQNVDGTPRPVVDIIFPEPPPWASGIVLKIMRFRTMDSGTVVSQTGKTVVLSGKNYPTGLYKGACRDYFIYYNDDKRGDPIRITTVSGNTVLLEAEPNRGLTVGETVTIVRLSNIESRTIGLARFYRIDDVLENEIIGVYFTWRGRR